MSTSLMTELERLATALEAVGEGSPEVPLIAIGEKILKQLGVKTN